MSNEQIAFLLFELHAKLKITLAEAEAQLPPEAKKTIKTSLGKEYTFIPVLSSIQNAVNELQMYVDLLLTKGETP